MTHESDQPMTADHPIAPAADQPYVVTIPRRGGSMVHIAMERGDGGYTSVTISLYSTRVDGTIYPRPGKFLVIRVTELGAVIEALREAWRLTGYAS